MKQMTHVCLFGSLRKAFGDLCHPTFQLDLKSPAPLPEVLKNLKIPSNMVQMVMVNFKAVHRDTTIHPGDRLSLFPREYALFADWKDLRF